QADAEGAFDEAATLDVASELNRHRPARAADAEIAIELRASLENDRHARERDHVVDDRGASEQAFDRGQWRPHANFAAAPFQALQHRGLFATYICARAQPHFQIEATAAARHIGAQIARLVSGLDGFRQRALCVRIFDAEIDIALRCSHRESGNRHAFDQRERIALHQHAIGERSRVALVRIARHVLLRRRRLERRLPFDAGGKSRSAATAQSRVGDGLHDLLWLHADGVAQTFVPTVLYVIFETGWLDDADAFERQPLLACEIRNIFHTTKLQCVGAVVEEVGRKERGNIALGYRPIAAALGTDDDLDERLEPAHAARAVALESHIDAARLRFTRDGARHALRAEGQRGGITGNVNHRAHQSPPRSASSASNCSGETRPNSSSSIITAGEQAQLPRQYTGSSENSPSGVVS